MITISDRDFDRLFRFVRTRYGINLENKRQLIEARLSFDIIRQGYNGFTDYINEIIDEPDGEKCQAMINRLSTNYTFFFRETDYIRHLCGTVIPEFIAEGRRHIKIWNSACSSGQEVYSVAMVLESEKLISGMNFDYDILGTDINTEMLNTAENGVYQESEFEAVPVKFRRFAKNSGDGTVAIKDEIKKKISWKYQNLLDGSPEAGGYDVVFCRNVMIYFTPQLRGEVTVKLCNATRNGGYLYTGTTESIDLGRKYFRYIAPSIYKKQADK